jgi:hypothetical protein
MQDEEKIIVEREDDALADAADTADRLAVNGGDRRVDRPEDEWADQVQAFETLADDAGLQCVDVDNDVGKLRQPAILIPLEPLDDLLARPMMIVVQMQDDGVERQPLVAAYGAAAADVLEAVEQTIEAGTDRFRVLRQRVSAFVRRAERARAAFVREVLAECLCGAAPRAFSDGVRQINLIFARDLMHRASPLPPAFYAPVSPGAPVQK